MADPTYQPKTYRKRGGDEFVVASGGKITVESGGDVDIVSGGKILDDGVQASAIADVVASDPAAAPAGGSGATAGAYDTAGNRDLMIAAVNDNRTLTIELSTKLDAVLAALRGAGIIVP